MVNYRRYWKVCCLVLAAATVIVVIVFFRRPVSSSLSVVSANPQFRVLSCCTVGTNHVYYYGDYMDRVLEPFIRGLRLKPQSVRMRYDTTTQTTMIWVRFQHPDYGKVPPNRTMATPTGPVRTFVGPPPQFRARWIDQHGLTTNLDQKESFQSFHGKYCIGGWLLSGTLEDHHGSELHIASTNGTEVVTLRVP
jgi:hypothetical protein